MKTSSTTSQRHLKSESDRFLAALMDSACWFMRFDSTWPCGTSKPARGRRGEAEAPDDSSRRGYEESVPRIIRSLFEMREINSNTEGILHEYQAMFAGSRGVTVVRVEHEHE